MRVGGIEICIGNIEDVSLVPLSKIAKAMNRIVRFAGWSDYPISVLAHTVGGALYILETHKDVQLARFFLLHDACEVIVSDVPKDFKPKQIEELEEWILEILYDQYVGARPNLEQRRILKRVDTDCALAEINVYGLEGSPHYGVPDRLAHYVRSVSYNNAYSNQFLGGCSDILKAWELAVRGDFGWLIGLC